MQPMYSTDPADRASHIQDNHCGSLTPLQRCSRCILQPQATGSVISGNSSWESHPSADMQPMYSTAPADRASHISGHSSWESYPSAEMQPMYSTAPADRASHIRTLIVGVLPLCRDAADVFYSPSRPGQSYPGQSLWESYASAEMQPMYSTAPADRASHIQDTHRGILTPLQRCSRCILQTQPTGPVISEHSSWESYPSAEMQSVYSTTPADWASICRVREDDESNLNVKCRARLIVCACYSLDLSVWLGAQPVNWWFLNLPDLI